MLLPELLDSLIILVGVDIRNYVGIHRDVLYMVDELLDGVAHVRHGDVARIDDGGAALVLVAIGVRHHEERLHPVVCQSPDYAFAGRTESAGDVRRKLPSKHQNSHFFPSLYMSMIYSQVSRPAVLSADEIAPWGSCGGSPS